nr:MAG: nonstructural protein [Riboviria sp.]
MFSNELYGRMIMHPICTKPAMVPACTRDNEEFCVRDRITAVRNTNKNTRSGSVRARSKQFAQLFHHYVAVETNHDIITPYTDEQVLHCMPRRDRAKQIGAEQILSRLKLFTFQKREAYPEPKAPRNISPVEPEYILKLSRYTYPFANVVHDAHLGWYMPGLKPRAVGMAVARVTSRPYFGADYSKFDGRQNYDLRGITARVISSFLTDHDDDEFRVWFNKECNLKAVTSHGVRYDVQGTMVSGSPLTTIGNTILNGFLYYRAIAHYLSENPDARNNIPLHKQAWDILNEQVVCYGDDSLGPLWLKDTFMKLTNGLGVVVTEEDVSNGATFLGRVYLFDGKPYSMADIRRVFPKMHITTLSCDINQAACNKAIGLKSANPQEWWITKICDYVLRHHGNLKFDEKVEHSEYFYKKLEFGTYHEWPPEFEKTAILVMAKWCGLTEMSFLQHIHSYDENEDIIEPWVYNGVHCAGKEEFYIFDPYKCCEHR